MFTARSLSALCLGTLLAGCGSDTPLAVEGSSATGGVRRIAVIPKGTTHAFWKSVEAGARQAGGELGVEVRWKGPLVENDRAGQIRLMQDFISQGVAGIALAPLDEKALVAPVAAAKRAGIPVVVFDSALQGKVGEDFVSFVATDNRAGGKLAGDHVVSLLGGAGEVVLLRYQVGSASTTNREAGFLAAVAAASGITVASDNRYAGATAGEAKTQALNMLDQLRAADAVFCPNESATQGMLLALRQEALLGAVKLIGFDASKPLVAALRQGDIAALVVQDPETMGAKAVQFVVRHLNGEAVEPTVNTGAVLVTRANMDQPEIARLLR